MGMERKEEIIQATFMLMSIIVLALLAIEAAIIGYTMLMSKNGIDNVSMSQIATH